MVRRMRNYRVEIGECLRVAAKLGERGPAIEQRIAIARIMAGITRQHRVET